MNCELVVSSCMFIDGHGRTHEVDMETIEASKVDPLGKTLVTKKDDCVFEHNVLILSLKKYVSQMINNILKLFLLQRFFLQS